jgi:hypothetical protein
MEMVTDGYRFVDVYTSVLRPVYGFELRENVALGVAPNGQKHLGGYDFLTKTVFADAIAGPVSGNPKRTFMLYHEAVGHGVLQGEHLRHQYQEMQKRDPRLLDSDLTLSNECRDQLERQANFAAADDLP